MVSNLQAPGHCIRVRGLKVIIRCNLETRATPPRPCTRTVHITRSQPQRHNTRIATQHAPHLSQGPLPSHLLSKKNTVPHPIPPLHLMPHHLSLEGFLINLSGAL